VEAHDLKGVEVRSLVATKGGVFAATDQGVFKSNDGGSTWRITNLRISTYALACTEGGVLLAGTENGVYRSDDYGETWALTGLKGKLVKALASTGGVIYAGTSEGVYVTTDETTWKPTGLYRAVISRARRARGDGLSVFHHKPLTASLSASVASEERALRVSGALVGEGAGLPKRSVKVLLNGVEATACLTDSAGRYECRVPPEAGGKSTLNLTVYFPGEFCYSPSSKTLILFMVNVTTEHGRVMGAGWYEAGSIVTVTVYPTTVVKDIFTSYVFEGWSVNGSVVSTLPSYTFTVNKPLTLTAVWRIEVNIFAICLAAVGILLTVIALAVIALTVTRKGSSSPETRSP
jgi:hypothetical protein